MIINYISRSTRNQRMKFALLIEYNWNNEKNSQTKWCGEANVRPFYKKLNIEHISGSTIWNVIKLVFITGAAPRFPKWGDLEKHILQKALSLVSPAGPTMIGAKRRGKCLNSKGSRSSENATFFKYFLNYFVKILQWNVNL